MAGYRELTKDFLLDISTSTVTARRSFLYDPNYGSSVQLPLLGDKLPANLADGVDQGLYLKKMTKTFAGANFLTPMWVMDYDTTDPQGNENTQDDLFRTLELGGEMLNIGRPTSTTWKNHSPINQDLFKRVPTVSIKVPKIYGTIETVCQRIVSSAGKVNLSTFCGNAAHTVLFNGASGGEFRNDKGIKRWRVEFNFEFRIPSWQKLYNEQAGEFQELSTPLYETANFSDLLIGGLL